MKLKDIELPGGVVQRARAGDPAALEAFYRACARPATTLARRLVASAAADDVVQDAFVDALRGLAGYDGRAPLGVWFRSIVVRRCLMHLRSPWQRSREWLEAWLETPAPPRDVPGALDLGRALDALPPMPRLVVWLHDVEGYTHDEIAAACGRTPSWSKSLLSRAHGRLRDCLEPESGEEGGCIDVTPG